MNKKNWLMLGALTFSVGVGISLAGDVLSPRQGRVEELTKKETELSQQLSVLQTQVEGLKEQQVALDRATSDAIAKKQEEEAN